MTHRAVEYNITLLQILIALYFLVKLWRSWYIKIKKVICLSMKAEKPHFGILSTDGKCFSRIGSVACVGWGSTVAARNTAQRGIITAIGWCRGVEGAVIWRV